MLKNKFKLPKCEHVIMWVFIVCGIALIGNLLYMVEVDARAKYKVEIEK